MVALEVDIPNQDLFFFFFFFFGFAATRLVLFGDLQPDGSSALLL
jgi:hypothetical protein